MGFYMVVRMSWLRSKSGGKSESGIPRREYDEVVRWARHYKARAESLAEQIEVMKFDTQRLVKENDKLYQTNERLLDRLIAESHREPYIIPAPNSTELVTAIAEAISKITYGPDLTPDKNPPESAIDMDKLGNGSDGGVGLGQWFPDVEFDPALEGEHQWPTRGGWMGSTPSPVTEGLSPTHTIVDGRVVRTDGTPTFQAGEGSPPPTGGVE